MIFCSLFTVCFPSALRTVVFGVPETFILRRSVFFSLPDLYHTTRPSLPERQLPALQSWLLLLSCYVSHQPCFKPEWWDHNLDLGLVSGELEAACYAVRFLRHYTHPCRLCGPSLALYVYTPGIRGQEAEKKTVTYDRKLWACLVCFMLRTLGGTILATSPIASPCSCPHAVKARLMLPMSGKSLQTWQAEWVNPSVMRAHKLCWHSKAVLWRLAQGTVMSCLLTCCPHYYWPGKESDCILFIS